MNFITMQIAYNRNFNITAYLAAVNNRIGLFKRQIIKIPYEYYKQQNNYSAVASFLFWTAIFGDG